MPTATANIERPVAKIIKGVKFDSIAMQKMPTLENRRVILMISVKGNHRCEGSYLTIVLQEFIKKKMPVTILLVDSPHGAEHTLALTSAYLEKNLSYLCAGLRTEQSSPVPEVHDVTTFNQHAARFNVDLVCFDAFMSRCTAFTPAVESALLERFQSSQVLQPVFAAQAAEFCKRKHLVDDSVETEQMRFQHSLDFLHRETLLVWVAAKLGYSFIAYPGKCPPFSAVCQAFIGALMNPLTHEILDQERLADPLCINTHNGRKIEPLANWMELKYIEVTPPHTPLLGPKRSRSPSRESGHASSPISEMLLPPGQSDMSICVAAKASTEFPASQEAERPQVDETSRWKTPPRLTNADLAGEAKFPTATAREEKVNSDAEMYARTIHQIWGLNAETPIKEKLVEKVVARIGYGQYAKMPHAPLATHTHACSPPGECQITAEEESSQKTHSSTAVAKTPPHRELVAPQQVPTAQHSNSPTEPSVAKTPPAQLHCDVSKLVEVQQAPTTQEPNASTEQSVARTSPTQSHHNFFKPAGLPLPWSLMAVARNCLLSRGGLTACIAIMMIAIFAAKWMQPDVPQNGPTP